MKAGVDLAQCGDLSRIRGLGSTGSPLSPEVQAWGTEQFERLGRPGIWWNNLSGGTDFAGAFIGGNRELPQQPGIMQCRQLGAAVEALPEVLDSMVVDLEYLGRESYMPLFVVLRPGVALDDALRARLQAAIRQALSPRFVPDELVQVAEIPRTLSGKKQELPIKKLLLGQSIDKVVNRDAMANPGCLAWYVEFAARRQADAL
jgi:acyl-coenzyme A synthetase/AMP-(fatty) acid ligase